MLTVENSLDLPRRAFRSSRNGGRHLALDRFNRKTSKLLHPYRQSAELSRIATRHVGSCNMDLDFFDAGAEAAQGKIDPLMDPLEHLVVN